MSYNNEDEMFGVEFEDLNAEDVFLGVFTNYRQ